MNTVFQDARRILDRLEAAIDDITEATALIPSQGEKNDNEIDGYLTALAARADDIRMWLKEAEPPATPSRP